MKRKVAPGSGDEGSWGTAYAITLGLFALEVVLLYLFTIRFS
ncbi:MAG: hypothetical protein ACREIW_12195 [Chthoniobacterales bacterium]